MVEIKLKEQLDSERILLRRPEVTFENARLLFDVIDRNRTHIGKWEPWVEKTLGLEDSFQFLQGAQKKFNERIMVNYFVTEKSSGDFCGICNFHLHDGRYSYGSIGYWQDEAKCGKGYITEAVKAIENEYFSQGLNRMEIRNTEGNTASANIPKKLEYHLDGVLRAITKLPGEKEPRDTNVWSKLHEEWKKAP